MSSLDVPPKFANYLNRPEYGERLPDAGKGLLAWHDWLTATSAEQGRGEGLGPRRALRAQLKRCRTPGEALFLPGFVRIFDDIYGRDSAARERALADEQTVAGMARVAILAAQVDREAPRRNRDRSLAWHMLGPDAHVANNAVENADVSQLRARRLVATTDPDAALGVWQRLLPVFQHNGVNLPQLAQAVCHWTDETRRTLSFAYFAVAATGPHPVAKADADAAAA